MKKRTIVLFACLIIACILLVLNGTLFIVRDVEVYNWESGEMQDERIVELLGVKDKNIFTVSERIVRENIEKTLSRYKVVNVERVFPSVIKIVILERVPIIAVKMTGGTYAVIDREGRVIEKSNSFENYTYDLTVLEGVTLGNVVAGEDLPVTDIVFARLMQIINTFETTGENGYVGENFCKTVSNISFSGDDVSLKTCEGMVMQFDASSDCSNKIRALVSFFNNGQDPSGAQIARSTGVYTTGEKDDTGKYKIYKIED